MSRSCCRIKGCSCRSACPSSGGWTLAGSCLLCARPRPGAWVTGWCSARRRTRAVTARPSSRRAWITRRCVTMPGSPGSSSCPADGTRSVSAITLRWPRLPGRSKTTGSAKPKNTGGRSSSCAGRCAPASRNAQLPARPGPARPGPARLDHSQPADPHHPRPGRRLPGRSHKANLSLEEWTALALGNAARHEVGSAR